MKRFLFLLLISPGCGGSGPPPEQTAQSAAAPMPVDEDETILKLSAYLIAAPASLTETQQNAIADYAMSKLIPLERSPSGLFYRILEEGQGEPLQWGQEVSAHYKGYFLDGQVFDSSYRRGRPLSFRIGNMISAWNEGLQLLRPGGKILLITPSELGYGSEGVSDGKAGYLIPPDEPLVFEVELL